MNSPQPPGCFFPLNSCPQAQLGPDTSQTASANWGVPSALVLHAGPTAATSIGGTARPVHPEPGTTGGAHSGPWARHHSGPGLEEKTALHVFWHSHCVQVTLLKGAWQAAAKWWAF